MPPHINYSNMRANELRDYAMTVLATFVNQAPRREPSEDPTSDDPDDAFAEGFNRALWEVAKAAKTAMETLGRS